MKLALVYHGIEYYKLNELLESHPEQQYIGERKDVAPRIFTFCDERYISLETWRYIEELIEIDETYYTYAKALERTGGKDGFENMEEIYDAIFSKYVFEGKKLYSRSEVDQIKCPSDIFKKYTGKDVVTAVELVSYHNANRLKHMGNLIISRKHLNFLYKRRRWLDVNDNMCFIVNGTKNAFEEFENIITVSNEIDYWDNYFDGETKFKETLSLMKDYYREKVNQSKSIRREATSMEFVQNLYKLYSVLEKEIYKYTLNELLTEVFDRDEAFARDRVVIQFIEYVRKQEPDFLANIDRFVKKANNVREQKEIYDADKFYSIYKEAINVERHIEKAYNDHVYAQYWLIVLMLISNFVRTADFLNAPLLELPEEYEWGYFKKHDIEYGKAQLICNTYANALTSMPITKTNSKNKRIFFMQDQIEAVAVAVIICNQYASAMELWKLFTVSSINSDRLFGKLGEPFSDIHNLMMNYTLATELESTGNKGAAFRQNAYSYLSAMRGHALSDGRNFSDTTAIYIQQINDDEDIKEIAYHTVRRGAFGWLYHAMLAYVGEEFDSLDAETDRILGLQNIFSPRQLENMSDFLLNEKKVRQDALRLIATYDKKRVKSFLKNLNAAGTYGRNLAFPCIIGDKCPKAGRNCMYCELSIKTVNALFLYRDELYRIIEVLETSSDELVVKKNVYLMYKLMIVFQELRTDYAKYDPQFISAFINMPEVKKRINSLPLWQVELLEEIRDGESGL